MNVVRQLLRQQWEGNQRRHKEGTMYGFIENYERLINGGEQLFLWRTGDIARLLNVHVQTARRYLKDIDFLGRFSFIEGGGKRPRLAIERDGLLVALRKRMIPFRKAMQEWDADATAKAILDRTG